MNVTFKKVLLVVLDGLGVASASPGNAITRARMRAFNSLVNHFPSITLQAAGPNVGLPWGEPGNSEVGHTCLGAGRIVLQDLPRIDHSISSGDFNVNPAFLRAIEHVKKNNSRLHLLGLLGDGQVHASQLHLYALLNLAAANEVNDVFIHAITDGRDTSPAQAAGFVSALEKKIIEIGVGKIVSVCGRFYAMDRANHWELTEAAYRALVFGEGETNTSALDAINRYYEQSIFDETLPPTVILDENQKPRVIQDGDAVIFFNYRSDRGIQLTRALINHSGVPFAKPPADFRNLLMVTMTEYSKDLPAVAAFPKVKVVNTLSEHLSNSKKKQYHISETEKFPHVTYFFSNGREEPFPEEVWEQVGSSSSYRELYQNVPEMSSRELTSKLLQKLEEPYDFYLVNYANPDMVGHTGSLEASVKAVETVDECLEKLVKYALEKKDLAILITSDHGNAENIHDVFTGRVRKAHTTNPVPLILAAYGLRLPKKLENGYLHLATLVPGGLLSDVAPTVLELLALNKPHEMSGIGLLPSLLNQVFGK